MSTLTERHLPCEHCGSSDALSKYDDGHSYCFSCNQYFPGDNNGSFTTTDTLFSYQSMPDWRGIYSTNYTQYGVKAKVNSAGEIIEIGFPYSNGSYKIRRYSDKAFYSKGDIAKAGLFGRDTFPAGCHKYIIVTEGELDAISLNQTTRVPSVSVQSASSGLRDTRQDHAYLDSFERIYLAFDSDDPGHELLRKVARLFDYNKVYVLNFSPLKDANDYVSSGRANDLANIFANAKRYLPETIVSSFADFRTILEDTTNPGIPYPFPTLTEMTYGLRKGESVLITAQEGIGKTEFVHAIEYNLLTKTNVPICAIYLEEPKKRHLQALAGLHLRSPVHLPDSTYSTDQVYSALEEVVSVDDRLLLYSHFGSDDSDVLLDTIRYAVSAVGAEWVILDHISMVVSGSSSSEDERRKLDYIATKLEMMVKELNFGLIIVSHVNDLGQTRGSRYLGKVADIRIDLERDLATSDERLRNVTSLKISKNRFSGRTGPAGLLYFDTRTFTYSEIQGDPI
jgi:twinkle protein